MSSGASGWFQHQLTVSHTEAGRGGEHLPPGWGVRCKQDCPGGIGDAGGRNQHLQGKGRIEQRSGTVKSRGLNGARRVRRERGGKGTGNQSLEELPITGRFSLISRQQRAVFLSRGLKRGAGPLGKLLPSLRLYLSLQVRALDILARVTKEPSPHRPWRLWGAL